MPKISPESFAVGPSRSGTGVLGERGLYRDTFFAALEKTRRRQYQRNFRGKFEVYGKHSLWGTLETIFGMSEQASFRNRNSEFRTQKNVGIRNIGIRIPRRPWLYPLKFNLWKSLFLLET